jgi:predicted ester cyclase
MRTGTIIRAKGAKARLSMGGTTVTKDETWKLANQWVAAWNAHDLVLIMTHYEDATELTSPVAAQPLGTADGKVAGKTNLRAYFQRGLTAYPELRFRLEDVFWGVNSVLLYYSNQKGTRTGEFMELSASGKVMRVVANYSARLLVWTPFMEVILRRRSICDGYINNRRRRKMIA